MLGFVFGSVSGMVIGIVIVIVIGTMGLASYGMLVLAAAKQRSESVHQKFLAEERSREHCKKADDAIKRVCGMICRAGKALYGFTLEEGMASGAGGVGFT